MTRNIQGIAKKPYRLDKWWKWAIYLMGWLYLIEICLAFITGYVSGSLGI